MLGIIELLKEMRRCKVQKKHYYIKPEISFGVDTHRYLFLLIPTIAFMPWTRRPTDVAIFDISWLNMRIGFGRWCRKEDK
jgi:hypothetical protein